MKALSVQQPYAAWLVIGDKTIEVRSWSTKHRGPLAICASAAPKNIFFKDASDGDNDPTRVIPAGCIIGIVDLIDCRPMVEADAHEGGSVGEFSPGAFSWVVKPISWCRPDPIKGALGLFNVPDEKLIRIEDTEDGGIFSYPPPQGKIKYTKKCPCLDYSK